MLFIDNVNCMLFAYLKYHFMCILTQHLQERAGKEGMSFYRASNRHLLNAFKFGAVATCDGRAFHSRMVLRIYQWR